MTTPIPSPPGLPLLGNTFDIDPQNQSASLAHLADIYGMCPTIFGAAFQNRETDMVYTQARSMNYDCHPGI